MRASALWCVAILGVGLFGCGDSSTDPTGSGAGGAGGDGGSATVGGAGGTSQVGGAGGSGGEIDKAALCADEFGAALTDTFGRIDGTVLAVVKPSDAQCALPNNDHVVLQVLMNGDAYRMVINIQSDFGDPQVRFLELSHELPGQPWQEGWHENAQLDYAISFGVHSGPPFTPYSLNELADKIADAITIGQKVSVYADSSGGASAHKVHRNGGYKDGAIVLDPGTAQSRVLLFHFENQSF